METPIPESAEEIKQFKFVMTICFSGLMMVNQINGNSPKEIVDASEATADEILKRYTAKAKS